MLVGHFRLGSLMIHCCKKWFDLASSVLSSVLFYPDNPSVNQSVNQSSCSINQSINQPINQSTNRPTDQPTNQPTSIISIIIIIIVIVIVIVMAMPSSPSRSSLWSSSSSYMFQFTLETCQRLKLNLTPQLI